MNRDWKTVEVAPRAFGEGSREVVVHCVGSIPTVPIDFHNEEIMLVVK
ncbi:hypothetical protein [Streptococcus uberis]|nr:hypothetical protein [Streptococcus uberis]MCK1227790.1 hypothetical protein [Streptococcus uberis]